MQVLRKAHHSTDPHHLKPTWTTPIIHLRVLHWADYHQRRKEFKIRVFHPKWHLTTLSKVEMLWKAMWQEERHHHHQHLQTSFKQSSNKVQTSFKHAEKHVRTEEFCRFMKLNLGNNFVQRKYESLLRSWSTIRFRIFSLRVPKWCAFRVFVAKSFLKKNVNCSSHNHKTLSFWKCWPRHI